LDEDILPRFSAASIAAPDGILTELPLHLEELPL
jgi:hypothetical protein